MMHPRKFLYGLAAAATLVLMATSPASARDFYQGRTVTIVINLGAGGATGIQAHLFAPYWRKHTAGHPDFIVEPMPGGAQLKGINYVLHAAHADGLTVGWLVGIGGTRLVGPKQFQVSGQKFARTVIAGIGDTPVAYARKGIAPGGPLSIVHEAHVKLGGLRAQSGLDILGRLAFDLLGVKYSYIPGYKGGADVNAAILRHEVDAGVTPESAYLGRIVHNTVQPGKGIALWYYTLQQPDGKPILNPVMDAAGVKPFQQVYRELKGKAPSGIKWKAMQWLVKSMAETTWIVVAPPGTPAARVATLRAGFFKAANDPKYLAAVKKSTGAAPEFVSARETRVDLQNLDKLSPALASFLRHYIAEANR